MNVLHVGGRMLIGGAERAIFQLIKGQRDNGIEADILTPVTPGYYATKISQTGAKTIELGNGKAWDLSVRTSLLRILPQYDAVHFHGPAPLMMFVVSKQNSCRLFYTHRAGAFRYSKKRRLSYRLSGQILRKWATGISANTNHAANVAAGLFKIPREKVAVTYNGIDFSLLRPSRPKPEVFAEIGTPGQEVVRIGTSANIREWKRIDLLLKAVTQIQTLPVHCYVIGDGPDRPYLEQLSKDLSIAHLITFTGQKKIIADYLQILDIFVLPSNHSESFGNSAVEAMAMGIPTIVMTDGGGVVEHITPGGGLIAESFSDLLLLLVRLIESESLRKRIGNTGKAYVRSKYTVDAMVKAYQLLYSSSQLREGSL